jgi:hypothetical protein
LTKSLEDAIEQFLQGTIGVEEKAHGLFILLYILGLSQHKLGQFHSFLIRKNPLQNHFKTMQNCQSSSWVVLIFQNAIIDT